MITVSTRGHPAGRTPPQEPGPLSFAPGGYARGMQATAYTYDPQTRSGSVLLDDGTPLEFGADAFDAGGLLLLRPGQRVRIEVTGEGDRRRVTLLTLQTL